MSVGLMGGSAFGVVTGNRSSKRSVLLTEMLQKLLHWRTLLRTERTKAPLIIDKHDLRGLEMNDHVRFVIAIDIDETEGNRRQVFPLAIQLGAEVDAGMGSISTGHFDDLDPPIQVNRDKMTGVCLRVIMAHDGIYLERAGTPIVDVVHRGVEPTNYEHEQCPED